MRVDAIDVGLRRVHGRDEPAWDIPPAPVEDNAGRVVPGAAVDSPVTWAGGTVLVCRVGNARSGRNDNLLRASVAIRLDVVVVEGYRPAGGVLGRTDNPVRLGVAAAHLERQFGGRGLDEHPRAVRAHHHVGDEGVGVSGRIDVEMVCVDFDVHARRLAGDGYVLVRRARRRGDLRTEAAHPRRGEDRRDALKP